MATLTQYLVQNQQVWEELDFSGRTQVEVSEIWRYQPQDRTRNGHKHQKLEKNDFVKWLQRSRQSSAAASINGSQLLLRLVWIPLLVPQKTLDVANDLYKQALSCFGHELAEGYCKTIPAGVGELHEQESSNDSRFFFSLHPKIFMTWSNAQHSGELNIVCVVDEKKLPTLRDLLSEPLIQNIVSQPSSPALICAILLSLEVERMHDNIKRQVRQVEVRTGHHNWRSRSERAALGDLTSLSAKMSGSSTRCGSCLRKQHTLIEVLDFVSTQLRSTRPEHLKESYALLLDMVSLLQKRADAQKADNIYIQRRVDTQLNAVSDLQVSRSR